MRHLPILLLLVFAAWLRLINLEKHGLYTDENFTMLNANGFWVGGANQTGLQKDVFTPKDFWEQKNYRDFFESVAHSDFGTHIVYNGFMHFWMRVFGNNDYMVRLPSVIFSLLSIFLVYYLCLIFLENGYIGLMAAFILAVDPFYIAQSNIARSYTLSFLLVLGSTWAFLKLLKSKIEFKYLIIYSILICLSLLNHYLNFLVPLAHGLVFLFLKHKKHIWFALISVAVVASLCMFYWFNWGGGYTAFGFLKDKNAKHLLMAQEATNNGLIGLSTYESVAKKIASLLFDGQIVSLDLYRRFNGIKILLVAILNFGLFFVAKEFYNKGKIQISLILFFLGLLTISLYKAYFMPFMICLITCWLYATGIKGLLEEFKKNELNPRFFLLMTSFILLFLSVSFVCYDALKSGHTTSLARRYVGISMPFTAIFMAYAFYRFKETSSLYTLVFLYIIFKQYPVISKHINDIWSDNSPEYAWFKPERIKNPYQALSSKVLSLYQPGDTLSIPGAFTTVYDDKFVEIKNKQYLDAQLINLYLPKEKEILETIDIKERNKVFLKRSNGNKELLFDFEETKYRY